MPIPHDCLARTIHQALRRPGRANFLHNRGEFCVLYIHLHAVVRTQQRALGLEPTMHQESPSILLEYHDVGPGGVLQRVREGRPHGGVLVGGQEITAIGQRGTQVVHSWCFSLVLGVPSMKNGFDPRRGVRLQCRFKVAEERVRVSEPVECYSISQFSSLPLAQAEPICCFF